MYVNGRERRVLYAPYWRGGWVCTVYDCVRTVRVAPYWGRGEVRRGNKSFDSGDGVWGRKF